MPIGIGTAATVALSGAALETAAVAAATIGTEAIAGGAIMGGLEAAIPETAMAGMAEAVPEGLAGGMSMEGAAAAAPEATGLSITPTQAMQGANMLKTAASMGGDGGTPGALTQVAGTPSMDTDLRAPNQMSPLHISSTDSSNPTPQMSSMNAAVNSDQAPSSSGILSDVTDWISRNKLLSAGILGGGALAMSAFGKKNTTQTPEQFKAGAGALPASFSQPLTQYNYSKAPTGAAPNWYKYGQPGQGGEQSFFANNRLPSARGGAIHRAVGGGAESDEEFMSPGALQQTHTHFVKGGGAGQDDRIPAMLSDGEYVNDASFMSDLGDGSNDAGAQRMDKLRDLMAKFKGRKERVQPKLTPKALASMLLEAGVV